MKYPRFLVQFEKIEDKGRGKNLLLKEKLEFKYRLKNIIIIITIIILCIITELHFPILFHLVGIIQKEQCFKIPLYFSTWIVRWNRWEITIGLRTKIEITIMDNTPRMKS